MTIAMCRYISVYLYIDMYRYLYIFRYHDINVYIDRTISIYIRVYMDTDVLEVARLSLPTSAKNRFIPVCDIATPSSYKTNIGKSRIGRYISHRWDKNAERVNPFGVFVPRWTLICLHYLCMAQTGS